MMDKQKYFLYVFNAAKKKYGGLERRLAVEGWKHDWQTLIATIMSAQSRDTTTIRIAERLFHNYNTLEKLANADYKDVLRIFKSLNYNKTKAKHVILAAKMTLRDFRGKAPSNIHDLLKIPGVGRKVANVTLSEIYGKPAIGVDTHIHRLTNVLGLVKTKTPHQTERELEKIAPRKYWGQINRIFVMWGQHVSGRNKKKLLRSVGLS